ncbi:GTP pyrophosphokinase family protein [Cellulophaga sp. Ld12]|uniref:GTP pyrophosphokinase n=1 Tax=Cellulophaga sp. Ld12 TaxID=3229535 RepID=UPI00386B0540
MKNNSKEIIEEFEAKKHLYNSFGESTHLLIKSLLESNRIKPHQITFRVKDKDSLSKKLVKKNNKYKNISEITDIIGIRIITFFEDDIDVIADIIQSEFEIDTENSIDKRTLETDKFGYRSLHYVASHSKSRLRLTEYKNFKKIKFELQIRSILQHSWAEIEHDIGYKGESEIPKSAKRTFYRVAALLEQADIEFVKLKTEILEFENQIKDDIASDKENIEINKSSLIAFIKESSKLADFEHIAASRLCERGSDGDFIDVSQNFIERLKNRGINTLTELEVFISEHSEAAIQNQEREFEQQHMQPHSFIPGAIILWILNLLDAQDVAQQRTEVKNK